MKAIFRFNDIYGMHEEVVNVIPVDDNFNICKDSEIYLNINDGKSTYHYDDLEFIESVD